MKRVAILLSAVLLFPAFASASAPEGTGRYVVVFKNATLPADAAARIAKSGGAADRLLSEVGVATAVGDAAFASRLAKDSAVHAVGLERLHSLPNVSVAEVVEPEIASTEAAPTPVDSLYGYQWDMRRMNAPAVWARFPLPVSSQPVVAVLDTGVAHQHPDLAGQVTVTKSTAYCSTSAGGAASYPVYASYIDFDAYPSWTPGVNPCTPIAPRFNAHGTHVAGTIASRLGGGAVVGVAPDAKIWAYKVFDRYRYTRPDGTIADAIGAFDGPIFDAILDATHNGVPVISMSLGSYLNRNETSGNATWLAWDRIAKYANRQGTLIVASAGNDALDLNGNLAHIPSDLSTVLSTGATGATTLVLAGGQFNMPVGQDYLASYSNYGAATDVSAPGGDCSPVFGCLIQYFIVNIGLNETTGALGYYGMAGTSMATPHVSAVAAHVRALHPDWTPGEVRSHLKETAQIVGPRQFFGAGLVDANAATQ